jgi:hypothetical protein
MSSAIFLLFKTKKKFPSPIVFLECGIGFSKQHFVCTLQSREERVEVWVGMQIYHRTLADISVLEFSFRACWFDDELPGFHGDGSLIKNQKALEQ